jgi:hypothetical protein
VTRLCFAPIPKWRNGNTVLATNFCQTDIGHAEFLGNCPHGCGPDFFIQFRPRKTDSRLGHLFRLRLILGLVFNYRGSIIEIVEISG